MMTHAINAIQFKHGVCLQCASRDSLLCAGLGDELLPHLCSRSVQKHLKKGETLFYEGDAANSVFNIKEGVMRIVRLGEDGRRQVLAFLGHGDYLGHTNKTNFTYSAEALTDVELCQFQRSSIESLSQKIPEFDKQFYKLTACLIDDMTDLLFMIGRKNALERVASFLMGMSDKLKKNGSNRCDELWLPMSRIDIADYLGLTLETVSRSISRLKKDGLINVTHAHYITINDHEALGALSRG